MSINQLIATAGGGGNPIAEGLKDLGTMYQQGQHANRQERQLELQEDKYALEKERMEQQMEQSAEAHDIEMSINESQARISEIEAASTNIEFTHDRTTDLLSHFDPEGNLQNPVALEKDYQLLREQSRPMIERQFAGIEDEEERQRAVADTMSEEFPPLPDDPAEARALIELGRSEAVEQRRNLQMEEQKELIRLQHNLTMQRDEAERDARAAMAAAETRETSAEPESLGRSRTPPDSGQYERTGDRVKELAEEEMGIELDEGVASQLTDAVAGFIRDFTHDNQVSQADVPEAAMRVAVYGRLSSTEEDRRTIGGWTLPAWVPFSGGGEEHTIERPNQFAEEALIYSAVSSHPHPDPDFEGITVDDLDRDFVSAAVQRIAHMMPIYMEDEGLASVIRNDPQRARLEIVEAELPHIRAQATRLAQAREE